MVFSCVVISEIPKYFEVQTVPLVNRLVLVQIEAGGTRIAVILFDATAGLTVRRALFASAGWRVGVKPVRATCVAIVIVQEVLVFALCAVCGCTLAILARELAFVHCEGVDIWEEPFDCQFNASVFVVCLIHEAVISGLTFDAVCRG